jgi:hypothetical protein
VGALRDQRAARKAMRTVSKILSGLLNVFEAWSPDVLRRLKTASSPPNGLFSRMLKAGYKASTVSVYVVAVTNFLKCLLVNTELVEVCSHPCRAFRSYV